MSVARATRSYALSAQLLLLETRVTHLDRVKRTIPIVCIGRTGSFNRRVRESLTDSDGIEYIAGGIETSRDV